MDWYFIEADEALRRLDASADGLSASGATRRLVEHGPNAIPETRHRSLPAMLLLAAALISGLIGEPVDTIAILVIVLLNAVFHTHPLPMFDPVICLLLSSLVLFAVKIEKWLVRRGLIYAVTSRR